MGPHLGYPQVNRISNAGWQAPGGPAYAGGAPGAQILYEKENNDFMTTKDFIAFFIQTTGNPNSPMEAKGLGLTKTKPQKWIRIKTNDQKEFRRI
jgi:hypothetical protein